MTDNFNETDDREFLQADFDEEETHADNPGADAPPYIQTWVLSAEECAQLLANRRLPRGGRDVS